MRSRETHCSSMLLLFPRIPASILYRGAVLTILLGLTACGGGEDRVIFERPEDKEIAKFEGGRVTLHQFLDAYKADGNLSILSAASRNETHWSSEYITELCLDMFLADKAEKAGLSKSATVQRAFMDLQHKTVLDEFLRREIDARVNITDDTIKAEYEASLDQLIQPSRNTVRLIFCDGPMSDKAAHEKAYQKALEAKAALDKGQSFVNVARLMSDEPFATRGVDKGPYVPGEIPLVAVDEAIQKLQPNQYSDIVESEKGYHLIYLVDRTEQITPPLDKLRVYLRNQIFAREKENRRFEVFSELRKRYADRVKINMDLLYDSAARGDETFLHAGAFMLPLKEYQEIRRIKGITDPQQDDAQIQSIIENYLALTRARELGLEKNRAVQRAVALMRIRYLARNYLRTTLAPGLAPTDEEVREEYVRDIATYRDPPRVHAREIYIKINKTDDMFRYQIIKAEKDAEAKINYILSLLLGGEDFRSLARGYSERSSAAQEGDIGWIGPGENHMYDDVFFSLHQLKDGEITMVPVKSQTGYYLFHAVECIPAKDQPFSQVRETVRNNLLNKRIEDAGRQMRDEIRDELKLAFDVEGLKEAGTYLIESQEDLQRKSLF